MKHDKYCCYCGRQIIWPLVHTWEHIIPKSKGGSDHSKNLRTCCDQCNKYRGARELSEWASELTYYVKKGWDYKTFKMVDMELMIENIGYIQEAIKAATPDMFRPNVRERLFKLNQNQHP